MKEKGILGLLWPLSLLSYSSPQSPCRQQQPGHSILFNLTLHNAVRQKTIFYILGMLGSKPNPRREREIIFSQLSNNHVGPFTLWLQL